LLNRNVDQPYKYNATWVIDDWSKIGLHVTQRVVPTGPWFQAFREGNYQVGVVGNCQSIVNPLLDVQRYLPPNVYAGNYSRSEDRQSIGIYDKMLRETDATKQRQLMRAFEKHAIGDEVHELFLLWWYRTVPYRSYVMGWKIGPSHYLNQDLATIWLNK
jgi:peptide/nickel transport system substrate-binding protein